MKLYIVMTMDGGIPNDPEVFLTMEAAEKRYVEEVNGAFRKKFKTYDEASDWYESDDCCKDDWEIRYWASVEITNLICVCEKHREILTVENNESMGTLDVEPCPDCTKKPNSFINHYKCPRCGNEWQDEWESTCDDECGNCGMRNISPTHSEDAK